MFKMLIIFTELWLSEDIPWEGRSFVLTTAIVIKKKNSNIKIFPVF